MNDLEKYSEVELERYETVIRMISMGKTPSEIQTATSVPPAQQRKFYAEFKQFATNDFRTQERVQTIVAELDVAYSHLMKKMQEVVDDAEIIEDHKLKKEALKDMASILKMRAETLQKAGVLNSEAVGAKVAEMENQHQMIIDLLKDLSKEFPQAARWLSERLAELNGEVRPI